MAVFYNQPTTHSFGVTLQNLLADPQWKSMAIAVAWVRRSGVTHIQGAFQGFLSRGGSARVIVGVDIENTSEEGLTDLLALKAYGNLEIFIFHNEAASTYHPKIYFMEGGGRTHLVVGSNNLTEAGLFTNTEAGLQIEADASDPVFEQARAAIASWSDINSGIVKLLDGSLLKELVQEGYVLPELQLRQRRRASIDAAASKPGRKKLFGTVFVTAPAKPTAPRGIKKSPAVAKKAVSANIASTASSNLILVVFAPKSRGGWSQLQLNQHVLEGFFDIPTISGEPLTLRQRRNTGKLAPRESRFLVYSEDSNKNLKVEIGAAQGLGYPVTGRPIVMFRRLGPREFEYAFVVPGEDGHAQLAQMLESATDSLGRGLTRVVRQLSDIHAIWPNCPVPLP